MKKKKIGTIVLVIFIIGMIGSCLSKSEPSDNNDSTTSESQVQTQQNSKEETKKEVEPIPFETQLSNGHFTAGVDFPAGIYDIEAVSGSGNVISSNQFNGGINAMMGVDDGSGFSDFYEQKYSNINLSDGVTLSVDNVTINIKSESASGEPLKAREQTITETQSLGNGHFTAGVDFPAGIYDIEAVSGSGNVISSNQFNGGINAIMGVDDNSGFSDFYQQKYFNINLSDGVTLSIDGVGIVLTPSK